MESLRPLTNFANFRFITPFSSHLRCSLLRRTSCFKLLSSVPLNPQLLPPHYQVRCASAITKTKPSLASKKVIKGGKALSQAQLRHDWLETLTCPSLSKADVTECCLSSSLDVSPPWVIGVDPDASGALAVLKPDLSVQVFDSPHITMLIGKGTRKRLDARSIVQLLQSFDAPRGTTAYIEQSLSFPTDGKQSWWSGGFSYGLWIGIFVASGYSVVPVTSMAWKNKFKTFGNNFNKDDSRKVASLIFPSMSALLKRKKDHGRAEALLIAAYGKGLKLTCNSSNHADN